MSQSRQPIRPKTRLPREARVHWLDAEIRARHYPNAESMAEALGISRRAAYDDHAHLRDHLNAPVARDSYRNGWYYTDPAFALPFFYVTGDEAAAVRRSLLTTAEYLGESDAAPMRALLDRVEEIAALTVSRGKEIVSVGGAIHLADIAGISPERFQECYRAVRERRKLHLRYHGAHRNETSERTVRPYHLHNERGEWVLLAHCEKSDAVRTFLLSRIEQQYDASGDHASFTVPAEFDAHAILAKGFLLKHGESVVRVRIHFDSYQARWIKERSVHPTQTLEMLSDESLILTMDVAGLEEVQRWVLGYGSHAEVLAPESLREDIAAEIDRLKHIYENK